jgi:(1->4)-alpha-D-glucan 1-alpha-D-glucosylmutase
MNSEPNQPRTGRVPVSTYRLQLNCHFNLEAVISLVEYLDQLGISDCYFSPIFKARPGSLHGYDITDYARINPELGAEHDLEQLAAELKRRGMGILLDIVPNHMCIADSLNSWWNDVLEKGPASRYAHFFDIDWHAPCNKGFHDKIILPILNEELEVALEKRKIHVVYESERFAISCADNLLPLNLATWTTTLQSALRILGAQHDKTRPDIIEQCGC